MGSPAHPALLHVLVADDEPHIGRIIKTKLEQGPFAVTLVYDGAEALAELERDSDVRLLILDLMMPQVTGFEVLERVRADPRWRAIPCLILTAVSRCPRADAAPSSSAYCRIDGTWAATLSASRDASA